MNGRLALMTAAAAFSAFALLGCKEKSPQQPATAPSGQSQAQQPQAQPQLPPLEGADVKEIAAENARVKSELTATQKDLIELQKAFRQADGEARATISGMEGQIDLLTKNNASLQKALDKIAQSDDGGRDARLALAAQLEEASRTIEAFAIANKNLKRDNFSLGATLDKLQEDNAVLLRDNAALQNALDRARDRGGDKRELLLQLDDANKKIAGLEEMRAALVLQIKDSQMHLERQGRALDRATADLVERDRTIRDLEKRLAGENRDDADMQRKLADKDRKIAELQKQADAQDKQIDAQEKTIAALNARIRDLLKGVGVPTGTPPPQPTVTPRPSPSPSPSPSTSPAPTSRPAPTTRPGRGR